MSLEHAILGFLNYGPFTGYSLKKVFDQSVHHFWAADQSQIYRTLNRLADNGWAAVETVEQSNRPDRKVYHITPDGQAELRRWLAGPFPEEDNRSAALVKVFFSGQMSDEEFLAQLKPIVAQVRAQIEAYQQVPQVLESQILREYGEQPWLSQREQFFWLLTLEVGMIQARSMLAWFESVVVRLENKDYTNRLGEEIDNERDHLER
jgi:PadR family transcriptional regulator, regulatory protein AphA